MTLAVASSPLRHRTENYRTTAMPYSKLSYSAVAERPKDIAKNKLDLRQFIHTGHSQSSKKFGIIIGLFVLFLWVDDWIIDSAHAMRTLPFRVACAVLLSSLSANWSHTGGLLKDAIVTYGGLIACEILLLGLSRELANGFDAGLSSIACLLVGTLVLCSSFPFHINMIGCLALVSVQTPIALLAYGFTSLNDSMLLWKIGCIVILTHYKKRRILVKQYQYAKQMDGLAPTPNTDPASVKVDPIKELEGSYLKLTNRQGKAVNMHTLLRVSITAKADTDCACSTLADMNAQAISQSISSCLRGCDISRYLDGSGYFCLLSDADVDIAARVAERIRSKLAGLELGCPGMAYKKLDSGEIAVETYPVANLDEFKHLLRYLTADRKEVTHFD